MINSGRFKKGQTPWNKGIPHSKKTKKKISEKAKGKTAWNKGLVGFRKGHKTSEETKQKISKANLGKKFSKESRKKMSESRKGIIITPEWKENLSKAQKGRKHSIETRKKMSKNMIGNKNPGWRGGINPENKKARRSIEYRLWREAVFARDNWTCQKYGIRGEKIHPHHIKNFAQYPELRFAIDNGITLSEKAHKEFHKKYGKQNNTKEQLAEFLYGRRS